jgi:hypothetical protein
MSGLPVKRVPTSKPAAADSATVPANSWPSTRPGLRRGSWPCQACMSEPQMPTASMRSTTSPVAACGLRALLQLNFEGLGVDEGLHDQARRRAEQLLVGASSSSVAIAAQATGCPE